MQKQQTKIARLSVMKTIVQSASWNLRMDLKIPSTAKPHVETTSTKNASSNGPQVEDDLQLQSLVPSVAAIGLLTKVMWSRRLRGVSRLVRDT
jgi:hypothetical protein